jgi:hypothetical protein
VERSQEEFVSKKAGLQSEKYLKMAGDTSDQRQEEGILATFFNNPCGIELLKSVALRCEVAVLMGRWEDGKMQSHKRRRVFVPSELQLKFSKI